MAKFDDFINAVVDGSKDLAKDALNGFEAQASEDTDAFITNNKARLLRWTEELANKQISPEDFADYVLGLKALAEIHALTEAGIGLIELERFRDGLVNLVKDKAMGIFL